LTNHIESQTPEMRLAVLYEISKRCQVEGCSPKDLLGHKYDFPFLEGGRFAFYQVVVTHDLISEYEEILNILTKGIK